MDFASASLEGLLIEQTSTDQLKSFLKQLDLQFNNAADENSRFGTLQILLPILHAHLAQLNDINEEENCLETIVKPLIKTCFGCDSMVAAESVGLVANAAGRFIARSFFNTLQSRALDPNSFAFGHSCLLMLLGQLVIVMKSEPDFVDQEPIHFIEEHVGKLQAWNAVQEHAQSLFSNFKSSISTLTKPVDAEDDDDEDDESFSLTQDDSSILSTNIFTMGRDFLDVDCCLQTISQFVQHVTDSDKIITDKSQQERISEWMDVIMAVAVAMLACTDQSIRPKLTSSLLPNLFGWHQKHARAYSNLFDSDHQWCEMLWKRTLEIFTLPATNLLRSESYGITAKFFDVYFGLNGLENTQGKSPSISVRLDLRFKDDFFRILLSGLRSNDSLARKYSAYILKRVIDFTKKYPDTIPNQPVWTEYFSWSTKQAQTYVDMWDNWFLLYETVHESSPHIVEPVLPRFEALLMNPSLNAEWWVLLLHRAFQNDTGSVKKAVLEYIFARKNRKTLHLLGTNGSFLFDHLLKALDQTALFYVHSQGTMVSPFGERLKTFIINLIEAFANEDRTAFLCQFIHHIAHVLGSYILIIYILEALADCQVLVPAWGSDELKSIRYLVDRNGGFSTVKSKAYLRKLTISSVSKMTNPASLSFSDIAKTVSSLTTDYPIFKSQVEYNLIQTWLQPISQLNGGIFNTLKERTNTFIYGSMSDDIPITVLRNQAEVLVRFSIFLVTEKGELNEARLNEWLQPLTQRLRDPKTKTANFNRALALFDSVSEAYDVVSEEAKDVATLVGLSEEDILQLLRTLDRQYLNVSQGDYICEDSVDMFLSVTRRILMRCKTLKSDTRRTLFDNYFHQCRQLLGDSNLRLPPIASKELSKPGYLGLLRIVYDAALHFEYPNLPVDREFVSSMCNYQIRRTTEAERRKPWGKCLTLFIRVKWECIDSIVRYAEMLHAFPCDNREMFAVSYLFDEAIEQLECASDICGEAILSSLNSLFSFSRSCPVEVIEKCVEHSINLLKENTSQGPVFRNMSKTVIDMIFQPKLLVQAHLNDNGKPVKRALEHILEFGIIKPFMVGEAVSHLHAFWSTHTKKSDLSMLQYTDLILKLLLFGPPRDNSIEKFEALLAMRLQPSNVVAETEGTAENWFSQNDYTVRVMMNDLLLRLDETCEDHVLFADRLLKGLLILAKDEDMEMHSAQFTNKQFVNIRIGCSLLLLERFVHKENLDETLDALFDITRQDSWATSRYYIEWFIVRLLCRFPSNLEALYTRLRDTNMKAYSVNTFLTITFALGAKLPEENVQSYFEQIFAIIMPWFVTNKQTIRIYSYCAWKRNVNNCKERGLDAILENPYIRSLNSFMTSHVDCVKCNDKISKKYMMISHDPVEDYNIEFIFRKILTLSDIEDCEKIGSRAFMRINSQPPKHCPFINSDRKAIYASADIIDDDDDYDDETSKEQGKEEEALFQKKITPWEMMLQTDIDLTKALVQQKRRRNDIIVVASLVNLLPNLAGLCRTCEIFNASQLAVHSLAIKSNHDFERMSVSSEKWMPMIEVTEANVAQFLKDKKTEGYTICGLEQTTTSVSLGEYSFPEKCVLLLGKEKEGTPADLLQLLDQVIEIPQYGVIRSLNVHVSAAICIFEYTKQMQWQQQQIN